MQEPVDRSREVEPLPFRARLNLYQRLLAHDHNRAWLRFLNAVARGGATGALLRGGLHLVTFLFGLIVKWRQRQAVRGMNTWDKLKDTARYAAFLATFSGSFVAVDEGIAALFGKRRYAYEACTLAHIALRAPHSCLVNNSSRR